ncbi:MAG TPA: toll/interleukin-1 receptor domain-containing protein [Thermoanaerobaculia bacterium]|nr:toll/interleukin-1 receptor domain-containing protein [Thermoanaerobaculia bacterium]
MADGEKFPKSDPKVVEVRALPTTASLRRSTRSLSPGVERKRGGNGTPQPSDLIFIGYAHESDRWLAQVRLPFKPAEQLGKVEVFSDRDIADGEDFEDSIESRLRRAKVAILLIDSHFLTSEYSLTKEVPLLLEREARGEVRIIPILVEHCHWWLFPWLQRIQIRKFDKLALSELPRNRVQTHLSAFAWEILESLGVKPPEQPDPDRPSPGSPVVTLGALGGSVVRLLNARHRFGRARDVKDLAAFFFAPEFADVLPKPDGHFRIALVGSFRSGKSALLEALVRDVRFDAAADGLIKPVFDDWAPDDSDIVLGYDKLLDKSWGDAIRLSHAERVKNLAAVYFEPGRPGVQPELDSRVEFAAGFGFGKSALLEVLVRDVRFDAAVDGLVPLAADRLIKPITNRLFLDAGNMVRGSDVFDADTDKLWFSRDDREKDFAVFVWPEFCDDVLPDGRPRLKPGTLWESALREALEEVRRKALLRGIRPWRDDRAGGGGAACRARVWLGEGVSSRVFDHDRPPLDAAVTIEPELLIFEETARRQPRPRAWLHLELATSFPFDPGAPIFDGLVLDDGDIVRGYDVFNAYKLRLENAIRLLRADRDSGVGVPRRARMWLGEGAFRRGFNHDPLDAPAAFEPEMPIYEETAGRQPRRCAWLHHELAVSHPFGLGDRFADDFLFNCPHLPEVSAASAPGFGYRPLRNLVADPTFFGVPEIREEIWIDNARDVALPLIGQIDNLCDVDNRWEGSLPGELIKPISNRWVPFDVHGYDELLDKLWRDGAIRLLRADRAGGVGGARRERVWLGEGASSRVFDRDRPPLDAPVVQPEVLTNQETAGRQPRPRAWLHRELAVFFPLDAGDRFADDALFTFLHLPKATAASGSAAPGVGYRSLRRFVSDPTFFGLPEIRVDDAVDDFAKIGRIDDNRDVDDTWIGSLPPGPLIPGHVIYTSGYAIDTCRSTGELLPF